MSKLQKIDSIKLEVQKKRARLAAIAVIHAALEDARAKYGLTNREFAERIGMKPSEFSRILSGSQNITFEMAEAVLRALEHRITLDSIPLNDLTTAHTNRYNHKPTRMESSVSLPNSKSTVSRLYTWEVAD
jgi:transcriptional regulator with XRE-family HTH domain